ncbi:MAG TPA: type II secretion system protein [Solirubrobacteraceae bacterium]|jgi:type II secretory pathway pseudopilin PulG
MQNLLKTLASEGSSESGITLIEVVISAMLVAIIAIATLTGFDTAGRATADERQHNQATLLAAQDEERLRGMNVTELGRLGTVTRPAVVENGTSYTIQSKAQFISAAKEEEACATSGGNADYIRTTSKVTWPALGTREAVSQSSIVPVPTSTSLLVNVRNQANEGVEGATVKVTGKTTNETVEQATPISGCVIFGALADSKVEITATKAGWINEAGEEAPPATEATLSKTALVTASFTIAQPGSILAEFESAGTPVQGDTFYAAHTSFEGATVGGTAGTYASTARLEGLYPFATPGTPPGESPYTAYTGECSTENNAELVASPNNVVGGKKEVTDRPVQVNPGATTTVKVEAPPVKVELYEGSLPTSKGSLDSKAEAKVTNCGVSRVMKTTSTGALEHPNQPYSKKLKLCLTQLVGTQRYKYSTEVANTARAGVVVPTIYMTATANKSSSGC